MDAADASRALMSFERPAGASGPAPKTPVRPAVPANAQKVHAAGVSLGPCLSYHIQTAPFLRITRTPMETKCHSDADAAVAALHTHR